MVTYSGHTISIRNVIGILGKTYLQVANARLVIKGFTATRVEPFNTSIFIEEYFPSLTSETPHEKVENEVPPSNNDSREIDLTPVTYI
ncbi:hypothetical protein AVEN_165068-1 [Araneus ventricosus]|uniref:Uncharacterized protein n=1 Tax=Araneus ventricosus TaxID=182803 RepID=A0A4Y2JGF1_ARAVE|nr:hypothetical protein AVEN_82563-1 [Araneus ventricosus]GBM89102.1 hypothetical protein AVEN_165068-1 [Araneus ventricosus]